MRLARHFLAARLPRPAPDALGCDIGTSSSAASRPPINCAACGGRTSAALRLFWKVCGDWLRESRRESRSLREAADQLIFGDVVPQTDAGEDVVERTFGEFFVQWDGDAVFTHGRGLTQPKMAAALANGFLT